jgi:hypothetical protein
MRIYNQLLRLAHTSTFILLSGDGNILDLASPGLFSLQLLTSFNLQVKP